MACERRTDVGVAGHTFTNPVHSSFHHETGLARFDPDDVAVVDASFKTCPALASVPRATHAALSSTPLRVAGVPRTRASRRTIVTRGHTPRRFVARRTRRYARTRTCTRRRSKRSRVASRDDGVGGSGVRRRRRTSRRGVLRAGGTGNGGGGGAVPAAARLAGSRGRGRGEGGTDGDAEGGVRARGRKIRAPSTRCSRRNATSRASTEGEASRGSSPRWNDARGRSCARVTRERMGEREGVREG